MALRKELISEQQGHLLLIERGSQPSTAQRMAQFISRTARLMLTPRRSLRWAMAKRRASGAAEPGYRAIDFAGF
jgi:hypothetical protein